MNNTKWRNVVLLLTIMMILPACSDNGAEKDASGTDTENPKTETDEQNNTIDKRLFDVINLDYTGLETVKSHYKAGEYYQAAQALLTYYKNRTNVVNPLVTLQNVTISAGEKKIADDALSYKFYVKNYTDANGESYQFKSGSSTKINWTYQPVTDGEFRSQLYRLAWFPNQAKAYKATGNEAYVKSWIEVYGDFWAQNPIPVTDTYGAYASLPVAERISDATNIFFYFIGSDNFTPAWLSTFLVSIAEQVEYIKTHYYSGGNNIYVEQAYAVTAASLMFPEFKNAGTWLSNGADILGTEVSNQFLSDGMQFEVDLSYHIGVVATFYNALLMARANNETDKLPANYLSLMRKATEVLMNLTYPDYSVPAFNDTRPVSWTKSVITKNLKKYVEMFPDNEEMKWMAYQGAQGTKPAYLTKAFTASGYYVLRNGWDKSSTMMIQTNNPTAAWHNQGDNGTFELYHNGRHFFPDSGCYTYNNGATREWFRSAKQHNTMTLNDNAIADDNRNGKFLKLETKNNTDILVTENQSYSNLKHRRAVFFVNKTFFVIVDEGIGTAAGKVSVNFQLCEGSDTEVVYDLASNGAHTAFSDNNNMMFRTFGNMALTCKSFVGKVSYNIDTYTERKSYEVNIQKAASETARFITVLLPVSGSTSSKTISAEFTDGGYNANGASVKVIIDGVAYNLSYTL